MYDSIARTLENKEKSSQFKDGLCKDQLKEIGTEKDPIKRTVRFNLEAKEKSRQIESKDKRTVHFMFNTGAPSRISPFARKYQKFLDGTMASTEEEEKEKFDGYIGRLVCEELEDGETNPIAYGEMPYFHCELTGLSRLSFSTADDPFYKTSLPRFYPEASVFNQAGELLGRVNPTTSKNAEFSMNYLDDIRDPVLKINDDRKIQIQLGGIREPGTVIILCVKEFDNTGKPPTKEGEFDRAWFRLANEETNQTIDYSMVSKIEKPEEYVEQIPNEDDDEAPPTRNDLTYLHGILYLEAHEQGNKWVFESFKDSFQAKDHKDIGAKLGEIYARGLSEYNDQKKQLDDANNTLKKSLEDKKLQAIEAAKKAKAKAKKGKGKADDEPVEDSNQPDMAAKEENFDLFVPASFERALKAKIERPFVFGPIEFDNLHLTDE